MNACIECLAHDGSPRGTTAAAYMICRARAIRATKVEHPQPCRSCAARRIMTPIRDHKGTRQLTRKRPMRAAIAGAARDAGGKDMSDKIYDIPPEWKQRAYRRRRPSTRRCTRARSRTRTASGPSRPSACTGTRRRRKIKNASFGPGDVSIKWFEDGTLNAAYNCIDRHLAKRAQPDRDHLGRRRSRRNPSTSPIRSCTTRSAGSPTSCATATSRRATASPSTCR